MEELLKALEEKDTKKVASLLYYKIDELSDEQLEEILKKAEKLALEQKDYELYKLVVYYYHEFLEIDKVSEFEELVEKEGSFEAKFHLADLYFLLGELEKSLALYQALIEEELTKGNLEHVAEIYHNMAMIEEELQDYEKAYELLEKAEKYYRELGDEEKLLHVLIYKAYVKFEMGETPEAKGMLAEVLPRILELGDRRLLTEVHLSFEEMFEDDENYDAALQECFYSMLWARGTEYYDVAFDALIDVLWQLFLDDNFEEVYNNADMFIRAFPDLKEFFEGVKYLALFKDGKVEEEELKKVLEKVEDKRLLDLLEFLGEAEL